MRGVMVKVHKSSLIDKAIDLAFERICSLANYQKRKETS
jgi:hypothetical protein